MEELRAKLIEFGFEEYAPEPENFPNYREWRKTTSTEIVTARVKYLFADKPYVEFGGYSLSVIEALSKN